MVVWIRVKEERKRNEGKGEVVLKERELDLADSLTPAVTVSSGA